MKFFITANQMKILVFFLAVFICPAYLVADIYYGDELELLYDSQPLEVTSVGSVMWSNSGEWLTFSANTIQFETTHVFIVSANGGEVINLTEPVLGHERSAYISPQFTPDDSAVTFTSYVKVHSKRNPKLMTSMTQIESINVKTGELSMVLPGGFGCNWSNDGSMYATALYWEENNYKSGDVYVCDVGKNEVKYIGDSGYTVNPKCFTPDNNYVVTTYTSQVDPEYQPLIRIPVDGGDPEPMPIQAETAWWPNYSPDGEWMLFVRYNQQDETSDLCLFNKALETLIPAFPDSEYNTFMGSWSPDGEKICYIRRSRKDGSGNEKTRLFVMDFEILAQRIGILNTAVTVEPAPFEIIGSFPNPFNPSTTIEFSLPDRGRISLVVYNVMGQKVKTLIDSDLSEGIHGVEWDGTDDDNNQVSSGLYISHLTMGNRSTSARMLLMK